uniref:PNPLA domain-containing protein n=1 Tax=Caenorhabditis japonica TaxID=281687 RepID=A0A8R1HYG4_CAEJA
MSEEECKKSVEQMNLSFGGCGFTCIYHAGVAAAIRQYAPELLQERILGASAGAIAAAILMSGVCVSHATVTMMKVVSEVRSRTFGSMHPDVDIMQTLRKELKRILPDNAWQLCTGRVIISLTRWSDQKNVIIDEYPTNEDLIDAVICSSFIPLYCGLTPPTFRGVQYIDGGVTNNQPLWDKHTITVSPFAGESDICPLDWDSSSQLDVNFNGTSIRCTSRNMYRLMASLWPRSTTDLAQMCLQGYRDTLRFLTKYGMIPCVRCYTIQTVDDGAEVDYDQMEKPQFPRDRSFRGLSQGKSVSTSNFGSVIGGVAGTECGTCGESELSLEDIKLLNIFPTVLKKTFEEAVAAERSIFQYLMSFRVLRYASTMFGVWKFPLDISVAIARNLMISPSDLIYIPAFVHNLYQKMELTSTPSWFRSKTGDLADFVINELGKQSSSFNRLVSVIQTDKYGSVISNSTRKSEQLEEKEPEKHEQSIPEDPYTEFTKTHKTVFHYEYMDENNHMRTVKLYGDRQ